MTKNLNAKNFSNILFINDEETDQDIYNIFNNFDLLVTDYSSVYFDFLFNTKPKFLGKKVDIPD